MIFAVLDPSPLTVCINCSFLHLFLIYPHKKPSFNDKVLTYYRILVSKRVKNQKMAKKWAHPRTPLPRLLLLLRYLSMGVNEMRVKILPLLCRHLSAGRVQVDCILPIRTTGRVTVDSIWLYTRPAVCIASFIL